MTSQWETPGTIWYEAANDSLEKVKALVSTDRSLIHSTDEGFDATPLYWASTYNRTRTALFLIEAGSDVNTLTNRGCTSLLFACMHRNFALIEKLLEYGGEASLRIGSRTALEKSDPLTLTFMRNTLHWKHRKSFLLFSVYIQGAVKLAKTPIERVLTNVDLVRIVISNYIYLADF